MPTEVKQFKVQFSESEVESALLRCCLVPTEFTEADVHVDWHGIAPRSVAVVFTVKLPSNDDPK